VRGQGGSCAVISVLLSVRLGYSRTRLGFLDPFGPRNLSGGKAATARLGIACISMSSSGGTVLESSAISSTSINDDKAPVTSQRVSLTHSRWRACAVRWKHLTHSSPQLRSSPMRVIAHASRELDRKVQCREVGQTLSHFSPERRSNRRGRAHPSTSPHFDSGMATR
jgi:hypothetical protein